VSHDQRFVARPPLPALPFPTNRTHRVDRRAVVLRAEDRGPRHERVGTSRRDRTDVLYLDAAVDLEPDLAAAAVDQLAHAPDLGQRRGDERLAAEAGVHGHEQHHVDLLQHVVQPVERRGGVQHQPWPAPVLADEPDGAVDVLARLGVERDPGGARLREVRHDPVHWLHHQVHVDRRGDAGLAQRLADQRADRQVRHVVVVHHVEVHEVGTALEHRAHFRAEAREIRGEYRRRDPVLGHVDSSWACRL
jgi:hypothetical protein